MAQPAIRSQLLRCRVCPISDFSEDSLKVFREADVAIAFHLHGIARQDQPLRPKPVGTVTNDAVEALSPLFESSMDCRAIPLEALMLTLADAADFQDFVPRLVAGKDLGTMDGASLEIVSRTDSRKVAQ